MLLMLFALDDGMTAIYDCFAWVAYFLGWLSKDDMHHWVTSHLTWLLSFLFLCAAVGLANFGIRLGLRFFRGLIAFH